MRIPSLTHRMLNITKAMGILIIRQRHIRLIIVLGMFKAMLGHLQGILQSLRIIATW